MQLPLFAPEVRWDPPIVSELPSWRGAGRVSVDVETRDEQLKLLGPGVRRGAYIVGVGFTIEGGPSHYLPIRHYGGDNLPVEAVLGYLREQSKHFDGEVVGANLSYDLDFLWEEGITFPQIKMYRDVQIAEPLIDELQDRYSLEHISQRRLGEGKDESELREAAQAYRVDPKKELWKLPGRYVSRYGAKDTELPLRVLRAQEKEIEDQDLRRIFDLESRLMPVLVKMRRRGVRVNEDKLAQVEAYCREKELEQLQIVRDKTGIRIDPRDVMNSEVVAKPLLCIGVSVPRTAKKGSYSVDKDLLKHIKHPVAEALQAARQYNKIYTTFVASVRNHMTNGRIHTTFNQLRREKEEEGSEELGGGAYGRLSSEHNNMQQQPARHPELGKMWRDIYEPDDGKLWGALDYSQQEPRWLTHYAELCDLPRAKEAADKYRNDPETDNHQMMAELTGLKRKDAKIIYLGVCYGMGGPKLCIDLGLPTGEKILRNGKKIAIAGPEGQAILDKFDREAPFVRKLSERCEQIAKQRGYIVTVGGRRCRFPRKDDGSFDWTHKALNRLIQGSSADQTKTAMVMADEAGYELQLQVHDELDLSVESREEAEGLAEIMRTCVPCNVPSKVDVEIGRSWGDSM